MKQIGSVYVNATITFKGKINGATLHDMSVSEWVHDVINCGDYEYDIINGDVIFEDIETIDD